MSRTDDINAAIALIEEAALKGELQYITDDGPWDDHQANESERFNTHFLWRVKPKPKPQPREWLLVWDTTKTVAGVEQPNGFIYPYPEFDGCVSHWKNVVRVREVLENGDDS